MTKFRKWRFPILIGSGILAAAALIYFATRAGEFREDSRRHRQARRLSRWPGGRSQRGCNSGYSSGCHASDPGQQRVQGASEEPGLPGT